MGKRVIVIVGPTCSGKTYLSIQLAKIINGQIISADSRQIYKKLNIGTAKPTPSELKKVKHYFINILEPDEDYNANDFSDEAERVIDNINKKNKIAIVAGGSGLYVKALIDGIVESANKDDELRKKLLKQRENFGNESLYNELKEIDPVSADKMLPQNWKRVMRALEVYYLTGKPIWQHHLDQEKKSKYEYQQVGLLWDRNTLYKNIDNRVDKMIRNRLVNEVKSLLAQGYNKNLNSLNTVGYKEIISYLEGEISLERAIELIKRNTRRYAKRQITWFKADKRIKWYNVSGRQDLDNLAVKLIGED